jgi:predicted  nucleic acid-binding Zn-ribbon protein
MTTTTFDTLGYFEKLKSAGIVQVEVMQDVVRSYDDASRKDLATKGDIYDVRGEISAVRNEIKAVRNEISDVRNELRNELKDTKHEMLKWFIGVSIAQAAFIIAGIAVLK